MEIRHIIIPKSFLNVWADILMTNRKNIAPPEDPVQTVEREGLLLTLRYVDESELIGRFRDDSNPFLSTYERAQFQRIVVFELSVTNGGTSTFDFDSNQCMFHFGGKIVEADNPFELRTYWEMLDDDPRTTNKKVAIIEKYMLPGRKKVMEGGALIGYLVFRGSSLPREGEGQVDIYGSTGGRFEFIYNFDFPE